jgi:hypothetical protein
MVARTSAITVKINALIFMVPSLSDEIIGNHCQGTGQAFWKVTGPNRKPLQAVFRNALTISCNIHDTLPLSNLLKILRIADIATIANY